MNIETTTEATTISATRTTHVATIPAERVHEMAAAEAFRCLCLFSDHGTKSISVTNADGSVTCAMTFVTPNER